MSAALLLARACRRVAVIDAGHPRNAAARELHGFLGRDGTDPHTLLLDGRRELAKYSVEILKDVAVAAEPISRSAIQPHRTAFRITTRTGRILEGRKLLFATGVCDDIPDLPGFHDCYGVSVHHCPYCDAWEHRGKHLLAFARRAKEAVGLGLALRGWSERVTVLSHGRRIEKDEVERLLRNGIGFHEGRVSHLTCVDRQLRAVAMEAGDELNADALFFNTSQRACCDLPATLGCKTDDAHRGETGNRQATCVAGVYMAGDADGDVQFAIIAAAEGATAAVTINRELQDEDRLL